MCEERRRGEERGGEERRGEERRGEVYFFFPKVLYFKRVFFYHCFRVVFFLQGVFFYLRLWWWVVGGCVFVFMCVSVVGEVVCVFECG